MLEFLIITGLLAIKTNTFGSEFGIGTTLASAFLSLFIVPNSNDVRQFCTVLAPPPPWSPGGGVGWSVSGPVSGSVGGPVGGPVGGGPVRGPLGGIVTTAAAATSAIQKLLAPEKLKCLRELENMY